MVVEGRGTGPGSSGRRWSREQTDREVRLGNWRSVGRTVFGDVLGSEARGTQRLVDESERGSGGVWELASDGRSPNLRLKKRKEEKKSSSKLEGSVLVSWSRTKEFGIVDPGEIER